MRRRLGQLLRYAGTAGTAALADLGGFAVLIGAGLAAFPAASGSFLAATLVNYGLTARLVFYRAPSLRGYGRFLLAATGGFAVNVGVTLAVLRLGAPPLPAKIAGIGVAFFANFALNAAFVFGRGR